jgi:predicted N-acetyltransferase YhbS
MSLRIRPARQTDLPALPPVLSAAFEHYQDALVYSEAVLDLFHQQWWRPLRGQVAMDGAEIVGVALAGLREVELDGHALSCAHLGPVAVLPRLWGRGLGARLVSGLQELPVDLLSLTVNRVERVGGFYTRLGFRELETWFPQVLDLRRPRSTHRAPVATRRHAIVERSPDPGARSTLVQDFEHGDSWMRVVRWPVTSRQGSHVLRLFTAQIVARGPAGADLDRCLDQALDWASGQGVELVWGRPQLVGGLQGFVRGGGEGVTRLAQARTERGSSALARALTWWPAGPSP